MKMSVRSLYIILDLSRLNLSRSNSLLSKLEKTVAQPALAKTRASTLKKADSLLLADTAQLFLDCTVLGWHS